jgi:hypothetical protein
MPRDWGLWSTSERGSAWDTDCVTLFELKCAVSVQVGRDQDESQKYAGVKIRVFDTEFTESSCGRGGPRGGICDLGPWITITSSTFLAESYALG